MNQVVTLAENEATAAAENAYLDLLCGMCHRMEVQVGALCCAGSLDRITLSSIVFYTGARCCV